MSIVYSGDIDTCISADDYSFKIADFAEPLKVAKGGESIVIADKTYKLVKLQFGQDKEAFSNALKSVNANPDMLSGYGQKLASGTNKFAAIEFKEVTLEQLIKAGLLIPVM